MGAPMIRWRTGLMGLIGLLLVGCATAPAPRMAVPADHRLVWADEFDRDGLPDSAKWTEDTVRNKDGWYNKEQQYYSARRADNAVVQGGQLVITARKESLRSAPDWGGQPYTSARLITRGKGDWTYGFFEIRARLPCGKGTWPAIWMVGSGGRWPEDGELDIMEQVGHRPTRVFSTVHTQAGSGGHGKGAAIELLDACTAFHNYQMHWTREHIAFGVDGVEHFRYVNPRQGPVSWPFDAPQFLVLNIAIGGDLGGAVDDSIFPVQMLIEHVKVWQAAPAR
jgi:beta-glucanase (GH16 family)